MLSSDERSRVERRLRDEREQALEALRQFDRQREGSVAEQEGELSYYRFHMADIGTDAMEREKQFLLGSKEGERLYRIDEALRRLYSEPESFGRCVRCGRDVEMERLELLPEAELCAACATATDDSAEG